MGAGCSSLVEHLRIAQWVVKSLTQGEHIELFLIPDIGVTKAVVCAILTGMVHG